MMKELVTSIDQVRIGLANPNQIADWSSGEVKKPETVNYRTNRPEKDGLFCEAIFGPQRSWECACGKYKRVHLKGVVCDRCKVEVTSNKVRRERMGHIQLQTPVTHIWYLRGQNQWLSLLLSGSDVKEEFKKGQLDKVVYYAARIVTHVDADGRKENLDIHAADLEDRLKDIDRVANAKLERLVSEYEARRAHLTSTDAPKENELRTLDKDHEERTNYIKSTAQQDKDRAAQAFETFKTLHVRQIIEDELLYREMARSYGEFFRGGMGAAAILDLIEQIDLDEVEATLIAALKQTSSKARAEKLNKRLAVVQAFNRRDENGQRFNDPRSMILERIPVIPPDLRPMVQLDGGRQATSDLNDLYRHVINRNNRLKKLMESGESPDIIINNERRMLQEAVDALIDNGRHGRAASGPSGRPAKSLTDVLKGKQGRFRQNLLGKRVDYSARSAIVVGPQLKLHQCGLPKIMALELFKPFVIRALMADDENRTFRSAKRMVEHRHVAVWEKLEAVTREHPVLLNRAPTLHRLGVQAFEPVLVDGKAIQIHPLVCKAFNADFDGDTMSVHVPLSAEAQAEARVLMLSVNNIFTPATGRAITEPSQDMVLGVYYLTQGAKERPATPQTFRHTHEIEAALDRGLITLHTEILVRTPAEESSSTLAGRLAAAGIPAENGRRVIATTPGRVIFNEALPAGYKFINEQVGKNSLPIGTVVEEIANSFIRQQVADALDAIKDLGFRFASQSGISLGFDDIVVSPNKQEIIDKHEKLAEKVELDFQRGNVIDHERNQQQIDIWQRAGRELGEISTKLLEGERDNPIRMMIDSGARGNHTQILQITAMKGLVQNSRGELDRRPAKSSFREGLTSWEYFISLHGTRKGLADTALRTADSGYLTRRLVDISHDLIVREMDCGATRSLQIDNVTADAAGKRAHLETKLWGRVLANDVQLSTGKVLSAGHLISADDVNVLRDDADVTSVRVRSVLHCESETGICATCYGLSLASHELVELGEAVGVIAAQSIGEPGTQLTMRTFHSGGVSGRDITHGLPRVNELFEARDPKGAAKLTKIDVRGFVSIHREEVLSQYQVWLSVNPLNVNSAKAAVESARQAAERAKSLQLDEVTPYVAATRYAHSVSRLVGAHVAEPTTPVNVEVANDVWAAIEKFAMGETPATELATKLASLTSGVDASANEPRANFVRDQLSVLSGEAAARANRTDTPVLDTYDAHLNAAIAIGMVFNPTTEWRAAVEQCATGKISGEVAGNTLSAHAVRLGVTLDATTLSTLTSSSSGSADQLTALYALGETVAQAAASAAPSTMHSGNEVDHEKAAEAWSVISTFASGTTSSSDVASKLSALAPRAEDDANDVRPEYHKQLTVVSDEGSTRAAQVKAIFQLGALFSAAAHIVPQADVVQTRALLVQEGDVTLPGDALTRGPKSPKLLMELRGTRETQQYLVDEVQAVYRDQGVSIHDKHIELIVRQITRKVVIVNRGDSDFLEKEIVDASKFRAVSTQLENEKKVPPKARAVLLGLTRMALKSDSWLGAASFQETTRILTEAAINGKTDGLIGLKENIIIGKLIPAGTGHPYYAQEKIGLTMPNALTVNEEDMQRILGVSRDVILAENEEIPYLSTSLDEPIGGPTDEEMALIEATEDFGDDETA
jgi:DNA-directed RNA polymerase subunit beta'